MTRFALTLATCLLSLLPPVILGAMFLSCQAKAEIKFGKGGDGEEPEEEDDPEEDIGHSDAGASAEGFVILDPIPLTIKNRNDLVCWRSTSPEGPNVSDDRCEWDWDVDFTIAGGLATYDGETGTAGALASTDYDYATLVVLAVQVSFEFTGWGAPRSMSLIYDNGGPDEKRMSTAPLDEFNVGYPSDDVHRGTYVNTFYADDFAVPLEEGGYPDGTWTLRLRPNERAVDGRIDCDTYIDNLSILIIACMAEKSDVVLRLDLTNPEGCVYTDTVDPEDFRVLPPKDSGPSEDFDFHGSSPDTLVIEEVEVGFSWTGDGAKEFNLVVPDRLGLEKQPVVTSERDRYKEVFRDPTTVAGRYSADYPAGDWSLEIIENRPTGRCEDFFLGVYIELRGTMYFQEIP